MVQGEYVEFKLASTVEGSKYPYQASNVTGMWGGKLMCETRNENPSKKRKTKQQSEHVIHPINLEIAYKYNKLI